MNITDIQNKFRIQLPHELISYNYYSHVHIYARTPNSFYMFFVWCVNQFLRKFRVLLYYLRNFIMRTMTSRANLIIRSFRKLPFHSQTPYWLHPRVFFPIHKTDRYIAHLTSKGKARCKSLISSKKIKYLK